MVTQPTQPAIGNLRSTKLKRSWQPGATNHKGDRRNGVVARDRGQKVLNTSKHGTVLGLDHLSDEWNWIRRRRQPHAGKSSSISRCEEAQIVFLGLYGEGTDTRHRFDGIREQLCLYQRVRRVFSMCSDQGGSLHTTSLLPPENDSIFRSGVHHPHDEHKAEHENAIAKPRAPLPVRRLLTFVERDGTLFARLNHGVSGAMACAPIRRGGTGRNQRGSKGRTWRSGIELPLRSPDDSDRGRLKAP